MDDCRRRSQSLTASSQTSGLSGDGVSYEFAQQDSRVKDSMSTEWTDEKHSLYLKSMEASFVDQLYNSMDLLVCKSKRQVLDPKLTQHVKCGSCTRSGQFKVLRYGGWQKIHFRRPESQRNFGNESLGLLSSPWIQHFISARKPQVVPSSTIQETAVPQSQAVNRCGKKATSCGSSATSCPKHSSRCSQSETYHRDMIDANTEMSDQNFADEDVKGEKASACSSKRMKTLASACSSKRMKTLASACSSKRMKTLAIDASGSDQVVPCGKLGMTGNVTE